MVAKERVLGRIMGDVDSELTKGTLAMLVLSLLSREPMYGYGIVTTVREETNGAFEWQEGSLYPALHKLEKGGLVRAEWVDEEGKRRRKYYHLTDAGRKVFEEKLKSWSLFSRTIDLILERSK